MENDIRRLFVLTFFVLLICGYVTGAPAPTEAGEDSEENTDIGTKIERIYQLLEQLNPSEEENDLKSVAEGTQHHKYAETGTQEKDMRSFGSDTGREVIAPPKPRHLKETPSYKEPPPPEMKQDEDESVKILAKALARLHQRQGEDYSSYGENMGTAYNEQMRGQYEKGQGQQKDTMDREDMEQAIARALLRLQGSDSEDVMITSPSKEADDARQFREEALQLIESRLLRDMTLANRLGLTVDDLIQDIEQQEVRDQSLRKLDEELMALGYGRDK